MELDANDVIAALEEQRNVALTDAAKKTAMVAALQKQIKQLEERLAHGNTDLPKPPPAKDAGPIGIGA